MFPSYIWQLNIVDIKYRI